MKKLEPGTTECRNGMRVCAHRLPCIKVERLRVRLRREGFTDSLFFCICMEMHRPLLLVALLAAFCACCVHCSRPVIRLPRDAETTGRYIAVLQEDTSHQRLLEIVEFLRDLSDVCKVYGYIEVAMKAIILDLSDDALQKVTNYIIMRK